MENIIINEIIFYECYYNNVKKNKNRYVLFVVKRRVNKILLMILM